MFAFLTLLFGSAVGVEIPLEFKLKEISPSTPLKALYYQPDAACFNYPRYFGQKDEGVTATVDLYRPVNNLLKHNGFMLTAYLIETSCYVGFWGGTEKKVLTETPTDVSSLNSDFVALLLAKYSKIDMLADGKPFSKTESLEDTYDCSWLSTQNKKSKIIKVSSTVLVWNLDNSILQPVRVSNCSHSNPKGYCKLSRSTYLTFKSEPSSSLCTISHAASMEGVVTVAEQTKGETTVTFVSFHHDFTLVSRFYSAPLVICSYQGDSIYASEEGHLFSFRRGSGDPLERLVYNTTRHRRSASPNMEPERKVPEAVIVEFPPIYGQYQNDTTKRFRRSTIWSYPEHQRLTLLSEHQAWGFSQIESSMNSVAGGIYNTLFNVKYQNCLLKRQLIMIARHIPDKFPYASLILGDNSIIVYSHDENKVIVKQGEPVVGLILPLENHAKWCNNSLLVQYRYPDSKDTKEGWLVNGKGLIVNGLLTNTCLSNIPPPRFLIPTYLQGSYDYMTKAYLEKPESKPKTQPLLLHFLDLEVDDGFSSLRELEEYHGNFDLLRQKADENVVLKVMKSPESISHELLTKIISYMVIPMLFIMALLFIICQCIPLFFSKTMKKLVPSVF